MKNWWLILKDYLQAIILLIIMYQPFLARVSKSNLPPISVYKVLLEHRHSYSFISVAAFKLLRQSWVVATEKVWHTKPKIFTIWPIAENVRQSLFCDVPNIVLIVIASFIITSSQDGYHPSFSGRNWESMARLMLNQWRKTALLVTKLLLNLYSGKF